MESDDAEKGDDVKMTPKQILEEDWNNVLWAKTQLEKTRGEVWASEIHLMVAKAVHDLVMIELKGVDSLKGSESIFPMWKDKNTDAGGGALHKEEADASEEIIEGCGGTVRHYGGSHN